MTSKVTEEINNLSIINLENLGNILRPDTSVEINFFQLFFFKLMESLSDFVFKIWGIFGKFAKKMADSSLLILSLFTSLYSNKNESC